MSTASLTPSPFCSQSLSPPPGWASLPLASLLKAYLHPTSPQCHRARSPNRDWIAPFPPLQNKAPQPPSKALLTQPRLTWRQRRCRALQCGPGCNHLHFSPLPGASFPHSILCALQDPACSNPCSSHKSFIPLPLTPVLVSLPPWLNGTRIRLSLLKMLPVSPVHPGNGRW